MTLTGGYSTTPSPIRAKGLDTPYPSNRGRLARDKRRDQPDFMAVSPNLMLIQGESDGRVPYFANSSVIHAGPRW